MSDEARAAFNAMVEELRALGEARAKAQGETQAGFNAAIMVEAVVLAGRGKKPKDADAAWKKLTDERRKALRAEWEAKADALWAKFNSAKTSLETDLNALAEHVAVRAGPVHVAVERSCSGTHQTTCRGADYARVSATIAAEGLKNLGVEVSVVPYWYGCGYGEGGSERSREPDEYHVVALLESELDGEVLRRRGGVPLREWVRLCWKLGANPRVFNPYLPHGFEEKAGLDFFGNDLRAIGVAK